MHPIEAIIADRRARGAKLDLSSLGGIDAIVSEAASLAQSPFASDIVGLLISSNTIKGAEPDLPASQFILACYANASDDLTLLELSYHLDPLSTSAPEIGAAVFGVLVGRFGSGEDSEPVRRVVLYSVLSLALGVRSRELRLAGALLDAGIKNIDSTALAKVMGVVWSRVREQALEQRLSELSVAGCSDASYEFGCIKLVLALECESATEIRSGLRESHSAFRRSCDLSEVTTEAHLMVLSIEALQAMLERTLQGAMVNLTEELSKCLFSLSAMRGVDALQGWQRAEGERLVCWGRLALTVDTLAKRLWEPSWWQPAAVIGEELLRVYSASKTYFRETAPKGLEKVVKPVLETSVFETAGQLHQVREWLRHNPDNAFALDASELIEQVERLGASALSTGDFGHGASSARVSTPTTDLVTRLMASLSMGLDATLPDIMRITLADWLRQIEGHADLQRNLRARLFIGQIVLFSLRFLQWCTDRSAPSDGLSGYLFERSTETLPHENSLQRHYIAMLSGWLGPMGVEVRGVSGGRCDVVFTLGADRFVVEVKRELDDATPDALFSHYGAQTEEYQNTSWRLGILLVLDLTREDGKGLHIGDAIACRSIVRDGETAPRTVFLISVAGQRLVPSDLTKAARSLNR